MLVIASFELEFGVAHYIERLLIEPSLPLFLLASPFSSD